MTWLALRGEVAPRASFLGGVSSPFASEVQQVGQGQSRKGASRTTGGAGGEDEAYREAGGDHSPTQKGQAARRLGGRPALIT